MLRTKRTFTSWTVTLRLLAPANPVCRPSLRLSATRSSPRLGTAFASCHYRRRIWPLKENKKPPPDIQDCSAGGSPAVGGLALATSDGKCCHFERREATA